MATQNVYSCSVRRPVVLRGLISKWPAAKWNPKHMTNVLQNKLLQFRIGKKDYPGVQFEIDCEYVEASIHDFLNWVEPGTEGSNLSQDTFTDSSNPFSKFSPCTHWCYLDYKHMVQLFDHDTDILKDIDWSVCGLPGRDGTESTFWMGSSGAYTPTHQDSYGCNMVAQIYGRKQWILFPPSDGSYLYPSRLPYEESSIFCKVNVSNPDLHKHQQFKNSSGHIVTLEPGDVLYVPKHWWHYVYNMGTTISINTWIPMEEDHGERITESLARTLVMGLMSQQGDCPEWINPNEEICSLHTNLDMMSSALAGYREYIQDNVPAKVISQTRSSEQYEPDHMCNHSNDSDYHAQDSQCGEHDHPGQQNHQNDKEDQQYDARDHQCSEPDHPNSELGRNCGKRNRQCSNQNYEYSERNNRCSECSEDRSSYGKRPKLETCESEHESSKIHVPRNITEIKCTCSRERRSLAKKCPTIELNFSEDKIISVQKYSFADYLNAINYTNERTPDVQESQPLKTEISNRGLLQTLVECVTDRDVLDLVQSKMLKKLSS